MKIVKLNQKLWNAERLQTYRLLHTHRWSCVIAVRTWWSCSNINCLASLNKVALITIVNLSLSYCDLKVFQNWNSLFVLFLMVVFLLNHHILTMKEEGRHVLFRHSSNRFSFSKASIPIAYPQPTQSNKKIISCCCTKKIFSINQTYLKKTFYNKWCSITILFFPKFTLLSQTGLSKFVSSIVIRLANNLNSRLSVSCFKD